ncbi:FAD binding domain-containing protein [Venturia nashicola]|uniref:FAD binding domain-containing protein n=1 Tax=Venturia nashicola TaxID=86259 RepID=A0A4Z1PCS9_9PEZI|nr:FAD binding domain-containing protein [Venturia nashicola]TLD37391.1 FAD binding domain-containing protein [Venturia nashicola]
MFSLSTSSARCFISIVLPLSLLFSSVLAGTCTILEQKYPEIQVLYPGAQRYRITTDDYWSRGCAAMKPQCVIYPRDAAQMATVVKILKETDEPYAVKSGGHNPNKGMSSVVGGPLISTANLNEVVYNRPSQTIRFGPGQSWENVTDALKPYGVAVVGGRVGNVGVAGYMLGGGLSFMSTEYGWAADNVVEFEVVTGNGDIVKASNTTNSDLFQSLKGGGGMFGIVTAFTVHARPVGQVWGGWRIYTGGKSKEMLAAIRDFTENYPDPKAAIIATAEVTVASLADIWTVFFWYNGAEPPKGTFKNFDNIRHVIDQTKTRTLDELMRFNDIFVLKNSIYSIGTETTPLPNKTVGAEVMEAYYNAWHKDALSVKDVPGVVASIAFQPMPRSITQISQATGGVVMDFDSNVDSIVFEIHYSYWYPKDDARVEQMQLKTHTELGDMVKRFQQQGKLPEAHLPLFMNDLNARQDYWGRVRNKEKHVATMKKYDPQGFMSNTKRTQGFFVKD